MCFRDNLASASRTGRKTTKYVRGGEPVWTPVLEEALMDGLEKYVPPSKSSSRQTNKALQRFPQRNKLIALHILRKTGVHRTAKQVGSRLQQLRETCEDTIIKELITNRDFGPDRELNRRVRLERNYRSLRSSPSASSVSDYDDSPPATPSPVGTSTGIFQDQLTNVWAGNSVEQQVATSSTLEQTTFAMSTLNLERTYAQEQTMYCAPALPFAHQESLYVALRPSPAPLSTFEGFPIQTGYDATYYPDSQQFSAAVDQYTASQMLEHEIPSPLGDLNPELSSYSGDSVTLNDVVPELTYSYDEGWFYQPHL